MNDDDLLDALADLQHDLGKYLALPVTMLPADATDGELSGAVRGALLETRRGPAGTRSAREIWGAFRDEVGERLERAAGLASLAAAVDRALAWETRLNEPRLDRGAVTADLRAVGKAIRLLQEELSEAE